MSNIENNRKLIVLVDKGQDGSVTCRFRGDNDAEEIGALAYMFLGLATRTNKTINEVLEEVQCILDGMSEDEKLRKQTGDNMWSGYETLADIYSAKL